MKQFFDVYEVSMSKNKYRNIAIIASTFHYYIEEVYRISKNKEKQYTA